MMRTSLLAIALVCAWAVPVAATDKASDAGMSSPRAEDAQPASADKHLAKKADKDRQVCRMEIATGSVMPKRVCRSVAEIEAMQAQAVATKDSLRH
jgi:hypothetical protein